LIACACHLNPHEKRLRLSFYNLTDDTAQFTELQAKYDKEKKYLVVDAPPVL
jgi:hypothetical protein